MIKITNNIILIILFIFFFSIFLLLFFPLSNYKINKYISCSPLIIVIKSIFLKRRSIFIYSSYTSNITYNLNTAILKYIFPIYSICHILFFFYTCYLYYHTSIYPIYCIIFFCNNTSNCI